MFEFPKGKWMAKQIFKLNHTLQHNIYFNRFLKLIKIFYGLGNKI